jgi:Flp pilus assembly pilin Flp
MFGFQSHLIFPTHAVRPAGPWPQRAERLTLDARDGVPLSGIHMRPDEPSRDKTLILGFGGNAWNGQDVAEYCLITALIALVGLGIFIHISGGLQTVWQSAGSSLAAGAPAADSATPSLSSQPGDSTQK